MGCNYCLEKEGQIKRAEIREKELLNTISNLEYKLHMPVQGYVIRHPGVEGDDNVPKYIFGRDPVELHKNFYEGFNPVFELRQLKEKK